MMRAGLEYTSILFVVAAGIGGAAAMMFDADAARGVLFGVATAFLVQAGIFWGLMMRADVKRVGVAHAIGVLVRFASVAMLAFLVIPAVGLSPAATLLSLVTVFFVTTLLEPVFLKRRHMSAGVAGATTIQTEH